MLKVIIPEDAGKIKQQIKALEWQIENDVNQKDKEIHQQALVSLKRALSE